MLDALLQVAAHDSICQIFINWLHCQFPSSWILCFSHSFSLFLPLLALIFCPWDTNYYPPSLRKSQWTEPFSKLPYQWRSILPSLEALITFQETTRREIEILERIWLNWNIDKKKSVILSVTIFCHNHLQSVKLQIFALWHLSPTFILFTFCYNHAYHLWMWECIVIIQIMAYNHELSNIEKAS